MDAEKNSAKLNFSLDFRIISLLLLVAIIAMLALWRPWEATNDTSRTIKVTGEAKLTDKPDEFVFSPTYEFKNPTIKDGLNQLTAKSNEVVAKLKELGVAENKIKTNSNGGNYRWYYDSESKENTYRLELTVTVNNDDLAQKVQNYLVTTDPTGQVSPEATFSDKKRKELENKARDEATKNARDRADQMADNLGFDVKRVKSVSDGSGFGVMPFSTRGNIAMDSSASAEPSLAVQPGENDLEYSVTVEYFIK